VELRRHHRVPFTEPVVFSPKGSDKRGTGASTDISLGGMFIETATPEAFGVEVVVHVHIPGEPSAYALPGIVRWTSSEGMGVQFGLLGAKETYTISELVGAHEKET
jgi:type IV pilus assembly protein PilZ